MTCLSTLALLEDYQDDNLTSAETASIKEHLAGCKSCRAELEQNLRLADWLKSMPVAVPDDEYFKNSTARIMARTVEMENVAPAAPSFRNTRSETRAAFYRSLVSVAASLFILFSAILIGSQDKPLSWFGEERQLLVASPNPNSLFEPGNEYLQRDIQLALAHGRLLIGSPGMLGRTNIIEDLTASEY